MPVHIRRTEFDPVPELARLRRERPVSRVSLVTGGTAWLVTRYDDARAVLGDPARFPSHPNAFVAKPGESADGPSPGMLLSYNPPRHTTLRRRLAPAFTVKRMRQLRPRVEAIVAEHLDAVEQAGPPADLVSAFALPIPALVICELLGVPFADRADFQRRGVRRTDFQASLQERTAAFAESRAYMVELVAAQRADPDDSLLGMLVREHGTELSDAELVGIADLLLLAGHDTTSHMISLGTLLLLRHPRYFAAVRDHDDRIDATIEEMLRYLSVVHSGIPRVAREDVTLGGERIEAGDWVVCSLPSANRDDALGADPDRFDPERKVPAHIAFGHGIHHCIGAPLARMQLGIVFPALLRRFPALRLAVPMADLRFHSHSVVYGLQALPVSW
ncbi:cytochrome P450 [Amycolatopsis sp. GM8]|uniref:cytochrome P450 n=1 Tax=Amycolatopsis sp. GM8 TaxID=2896530 RepID=UPI001F17CC75|nr:cytochrome P450 [Amycolatopsis sp. GM8]